MSSYYAAATIHGLELFRAHDVGRTCSGPFTYWAFTPEHEEIAENGDVYLLDGQRVGGLQHDAQNDHWLPIDPDGYAMSREGETLYGSGIESAWIENDRARYARLDDAVMFLRLCWLKQNPQSPLAGLGKAA